MASEAIYLIYIGEKFYDLSHTMMSSLYKVENGGSKFTRYDLGLLETALAEGHTVRIDPATDRQLLWAYGELEKFR